MLNKKKNNKGFTLVELLVVIAIIGILAVVAVPALFKNINKAKIADVESDYSAIKSAVLSYYTDKNDLPAELDNLANEMDSVPKTSALNGTYSLATVTTQSNVKKLALKITGAKATSEQMKKLIADIGTGKVCKSENGEAATDSDGKGDIYLILIDNTSM